MLGDTILTKLEPVEGMVVVAVIGVGVVGFLFALTAITSVSAIDMAGRLAIGIAGLGFSGGYVYKTAKIVRRR
jgi:hypothetical protein